jgi:hypothetical protein
MFMNEEDAFWCLDITVELLGYFSPDMSTTQVGRALLAYSTAQTLQHGAGWPAGCLLIFITAAWWIPPSDP